MSEAHNAIDILGQDLSSTDTDFPALEAGTVDCVISDCKVEAQKAPKTGQNLMIKLKTAMPWKTTTGVMKPPGFPIRDIVGLTPSENYNPKQRLAAIREAVLGDKNGAFGDPAQYIGKPVTVRIKVESSEEFGNQTKVASYVRRTS